MAFRSLLTRVGLHTSLALLPIDLTFRAIIYFPASSMWTLGHPELRNPTFAHVILGILPLELLWIDRSQRGDQAPRRGAVHHHGRRRHDVHRAAADRAADDRPERGLDNHPIVSAVGWHVLAPCAKQAISQVARASSPRSLCDVVVEYRRGEVARWPEVAQRAPPGLIISSETGSARSCDAERRACSGGVARVTRSAGPHRRTPRDDGERIRTAARTQSCPLINCLVRS